MSHNEKTGLQSPVVPLPGAITTKKAGNKYTRPILVISSAAGRARKDLDLFIELWKKDPQIPHDLTEITKSFLLAIYHKMYLLLNVTAGYKTAIAPFRSVRAEQGIFKGMEPPELQILLKIAERRVLSLTRHWVLALKQLHFPIGLYSAMSEGDQVPTRSCRELLVQFVLSRKEFMDRLPSSDPTVFLKDIGAHIGLTLPSTAPSSEEDNSLRRDFNDGTPEMFFVCFHRKQPAEAGSFYVGASQESWGRLVEVAAIRKRDRDHRIEGYALYAERAFKALRRREMEACNGTIGMAPDGQLGSLRLKLTEDMRDDKSFLGRTYEDGQAFNKEGVAQKCCYVCKGMMGYRTHVVLDEEEVKNELATFNWKLRGENYHACAEVIVSHQCAIDWEKSGHSFQS
ncbi:hypothetical protein FQN49_003205 [Arthroderma sp. PD_2]|nr:hypothetical protein FQN49_003205 [Arthroderma sp. PD_2]